MKRWLRFVWIFGVTAGLVILWCVTTEAAQKVTVVYPNMLVHSGKGTMEVLLRDSYFQGSSRKYRQELAEASLAFCAAANTDGRAGYVIDGLKKAGFERFDSGNSYQRDDQNNAGYTFAVKQIQKGGRSYDLIAVVLRGSLGQEWYGNFEIGNEKNGVHQGFGLAESAVYQKLMEYCQKGGFTNPRLTKFWIMGHSRGAAVANLLAADLNENSRYQNHHIYAYTFATPNTVKEAIAYKNIYNIINDSDFITLIPIKDWGYERHGITLMLKSGKTEQIQNINQFIKTAGKLASNVEGYYDNYYAIQDSTYSLYEYFQSIADLMIGGKRKEDALSIMAESMYYENAFQPISWFLFHYSINGGIATSHMPDTYATLLKKGKVQWEDKK